MNGVTAWEVVIGLEAHVQLQTRSKIFSGASTAYGAEPNTQASGIDLGLPGVLPVLNAEAVRMAVKFGLAIGAHVAPRSVFARKNYFYPDLPKGYQISGTSCRSSQMIRSISAKVWHKNHRHHARIWKRMPVNPCMRISTVSAASTQPRRYAAAGDRLRTRYAALQAAAYK